MNKKLVVLFNSVALLVLPVAALAVFDPGSTPNTVGLSVTEIVNVILNFIWPLFAGFAVIMFLVAGFIFLSASGDPGKVGQARVAVLWAIVGVVIGLISFSIPFIVRVTLGSGI